MVCFLLFILILFIDGTFSLESEKLVILFKVPWSSSNLQPNIQTSEKAHTISLSTAVSFHQFVILAIFMCVYFPQEGGN